MFVDNAHQRFYLVFQKLHVRIQESSGDRKKRMLQQESSSGMDSTDENEGTDYEVVWNNCKETKVLEWRENGL